MMTRDGNNIPFDYQNFLNNCSTRAGIYIMRDAAENILYIGKARNLKKRIASYFKTTASSAKTKRLVKQIASIELTITATENDALLLESNLIKQYLPRYNILLRDDKSYPFLFISIQQDFPRLSFHRGSQKAKGRYFGPYPNGRAVRQTVTLLQKLFKLRSCDDGFFKNRSRPCLQYQIQRCTGPCANKVSVAEYQAQVKAATLFLEGKSEEVITAWVANMEQAASKKDYERAALIRDQIKQLRHIQEQHAMHTQHGDADVLGVASYQHSCCVCVVSVRQGRVLGSKAFFPKVPRNFEVDELLSEFLSRYYTTHQGLHPIPHEIITPLAIVEQNFLAEGLSHMAKHTVKIHSQVRTTRLVWQQLAMQNATESLQMKLSQLSTVKQQMMDLKAFFKMPEIPQRLECFDISHTQGEFTVASCVVFNQEGPLTQDYRRYNIKEITEGDDYAAISQALWRRYRHCKEQEALLPDVIIIDGGRGQLNCAYKVLAELQLTDVILLSIAKGAARKAGLESIFQYGIQQALNTEAHEQAFLLLQHIRDEAHRFAITAHRKQRTKQRQQSILLNIPGIGATRRRLLLTHFGGLAQLQRASAHEISKIPGISSQLAQRIYDYFQK